MGANTVIVIAILFVMFLFLSAMRIWARFAVGLETKTRGEIEREREIARQRAARGELPPPTRPDPTRRHPGATVIKRNLTKAEATESEERA